MNAKVAMAKPKKSLLTLHLNDRVGPASNNSVLLDRKPNRKPSRLVSRFRRSHHFAVRTFANVGNKGTLAIPRF
jgi:hypothetical protein